jgi:hypothetical protein
MKIHIRPPLPPIPPAPPPKSPPTAIQLKLQAEELIKTAQQQQTRLKKLYGARKNCEDFDEDNDADSEKRQRDRRSNRDIDFLA